MKNDHIRSSAKKGQNNVSGCKDVEDENVWDTSKRYDPDDLSGLSPEFVEWVKAAKHETFIMEKDDYAPADHFSPEELEAWNEIVEMNRYDPFDEEARLQEILEEACEAEIALLLKLRLSFIESGMEYPGALDMLYELRKEKHSS